MAKLITDFEELFKENFTDRDKNYTLEKALKYWKKIADSKSIRSEVMEIAINRMFSRLAHGDKFDDECPCGCGGLGIATTFIHSVVVDMLAMDKDIQTKTAEILNDRFKVVIEAQMKKISKTDKEFVKMNRPPLMDRNPVLKPIKKAWTWLMTEEE